MIQQETRLKVADNTGAKRNPLYPCYGWLYKKICKHWRYNRCYC